MKNILLLFTLISSTSHAAHTHGVCTMEYGIAKISTMPLTHFVGDPSGHLIESTYPYTLGGSFDRKVSLKTCLESITEDFNGAIKPNGTAANIANIHFTKDGITKEYLLIEVR